MIFKSFHVSVHDFQRYDVIVKVGLSIGFIFYRMMYNGSSDIKFIWVSQKNPFIWIFWISYEIWEDKSGLKAVKIWERPTREREIISVKARSNYIQSIGYI